MFHNVRISVATVAPLPAAIANWLLTPAIVPQTYSPFFIKKLFFTVS